MLTLLAIQICWISP